MAKLPDQLKVSVRDFYGIRTADLDLTPGCIHAVHGINGAGKTSMFRALLAVLSNVVPGKKNEGARKIRRGAEFATVKMTTPGLQPGLERKVVWSKKSVDVTTDPEGGVPTATSVVVGAQKITSLDANGRAAFFINLLKATVTKDDLKLALCDALGEDRGLERLADLWDVINDGPGWDTAAKEAEDASKGAQGAWRSITGKPKWGPDVHSQWSPPGFEDLPEGATKETLIQAIKNAESLYRAAVEYEAVNEAEIKRLNDLAAQAGPIETELVELRKNYTAKQSSLETAKSALLTMPAPGKTSVQQPCPHCKAAIELQAKGTPLTLSQVALVVPTEVKVSQKSIEEATTKIGDQEKAVRDIQNELIQMSNQIAIQEKTLKGAEEAGGKAMELSAKKPPADATDSKKAEAMLNTARVQSLAFEKKGSAEEQAVKIKEEDKLREILKPEGLRQKKLSDALNKFNNEVLRPLCTAGGWETISILPDLAINYGLSAYEDQASRGEALIVDATLQTAVAKLIGEDLLIIDDFECLDGFKADGFINLLVDNALRAVLFIKCDTPQDGIDLDRVGRSYWLDKGELKPLAALTPVGAAK